MPLYNEIKPKIINAIPISKFLYVNFIIIPPQNLVFGDRLRIWGIVILMLLIGNVYALGINPENVGRDDQYTYDYFNNMLSSFSDIFEKMIDNNETYINESRSVFNELYLLKNETVLYKNHNITSPVDYVIQPFYKFSKELVYLCNLNKRLYDDLAENTTESLIDARATLVEINKTLILMDGILDEIDSLTYLKKGNETLLFNTSHIRELMKIYRLKLSKHDIPISGLRIYISNPNPIIFENVSIYGIAEDGEITVYIGNVSYNLTVKNNTFSMVYSFSREGVYEIYAMQNGNKSNIIYANVSKIPTYIFTDKDVYKGYVNSNITISGYVTDYYGNRMNGTVYILNDSIPLNNGSFIYNIFSNKSLKMSVSISYIGDVYHLPSKKIITAEFLKYPTRIVISADRYNITLGETINLTGEIFGVNREVDIYIVVNNETYKRIRTDGKFVTNVSFNSSGVYEIYAIYYGNDVYEGAKSNILKINVEERNYLMYIIILILAGIVGIYAYKFGKRDKEKKTEDIETSEIEDKEIKKEVDLTAIPNDIAESYNILFNSLIKKYYLPRNLTPRELLKMVGEKNPKIYNDLKFITDVHERYVYGGFEIGKDTLDKYIQKIKKILEQIYE